MSKSIDSKLAKKKQAELLEKLNKISIQLIKGGDLSLEAIYQLKDLLNSLEIYDLHGNTDPKLVSTVWTVKKFMHDLEANLGIDTRGFPKKSGTEMLQNIAKFIGIYIQTSLFRNRPKDSQGTLADVIYSFYELLHLAEKAFEENLAPDEYVVF
jgi:hypothetical protein